MTGHRRCPRASRHQGEEEEPQVCHPLNEPSARGYTLLRPSRPKQQSNLLQYSASGTEPTPNDISLAPYNGVWRNEAQFSVAFLQVSFLWNFPKLVVGCVFSFLLEAGGFKSSFFSNFQTKFFFALFHPFSFFFLFLPRQASWML